MRKIFTAFGNLFTDSWSWQSFVSSFNCFNFFSNGCIKWNTAATNNVLLLLAGLFIRFFVKRRAACRKSEFAKHRQYQKWASLHLAWCGELKSLRRFWPSLVAFRTCILPLRFFSRYCGFPVSSKTNISKFQFNQVSGRWRATDCSGCFTCKLSLIILFKCRSLPGLMIYVGPS